MDAIILNGRDNVATAVRALTKGALARIGADGGTVTLALVEDVPMLHKIALGQLAPGDPVVKYGEVIGTMTRAAAAGSLVHVHNMRSRRARQPQDAAGTTGAGALAEAEAHVDNGSAMLGLVIAPAHRQGTIENLARMLQMVRLLLLAFPLTDDLESAAEYRP